MSFSTKRPTRDSHLGYPQEHRHNIYDLLEELSCKAVERFPHGISPGKLISSAPKTKSSLAA